MVKIFFGAYKSSQFSWTVFKRKCLLKLFCFVLLFLLIFKSRSNLGLFGTEWEKKVVEVTKDDRDVVDSSVLREIADATQDYNLYNEIMTKLFERIDQPPKQWKIVYKV